MNDINGRQNRPSEKTEHGRRGHTAYIWSLLLLAPPLSVGIWLYSLDSYDGWMVLVWIYLMVYAFPVFILCALPICILRPAFGLGGVVASATTCTAAMVGLTILVGAMGTADGREIVNAMLSGGFIGLLLSLLLPGKHRPSETAAASGHPDDNRPASASENQSG